MKIVFFDGVCGVCNKSVDLLLKLDEREQLRFAPIQGEAAKRYLSDECRENLDTISFFDGKTLTFRTTALLKIARTLGGIWWVFYPLIIIPVEWRDLAYDWFARRRYRYFGKKEACRIPTPEERSRFLD
ncbi:DCC1-like thiol-disulfide oxidoreductase family protein [Pelagicoccus sp. SDUM812003]|uniref:thiol-disulfide oxidoreductase DCC family protein n=1 Tax=Pelagicoccus sp. SDUM812003 TaxID=3041267 RepID=UPI00280CFAB3|nr:DCC1-like thiol-disulfide oxidoreductase family protein [Pelagicoccus sp. SDUM812003]MDQ8202329.1 DCC1-like thiol-disulfide oxidoreductase family protein [Pelagicoccus sp. SDUM812003]